MDRRKQWLVFAACVVAVVVASFVPTGAAPGPVQGTHAAYDSLWHAATYAGVAAVGFYAAEREGWLVVAVGVVALGAAVEVGQAFVVYRTASLVDAATNTVGVAVALASFRAARWFNV